MFFMLQRIQLFLPSILRRINSLSFFAAFLFFAQEFERRTKQFVISERNNVDYYTASITLFLETLVCFFLFCKEVNKLFC